MFNLIENWTLHTMSWVSSGKTMPEHSSPRLSRVTSKYATLTNSFTTLLNLFTCSNDLSV
jgi:hypothetical protein